MTDFLARVDEIVARRHQLEDQIDALCIEHGKLLGDWYDPAKYHWGSRPPARKDGCTSCYEWRRFGPGQRHFGWGWWMRCDYFRGWPGHPGCGCEHHKTECWVA